MLFFRVFFVLCCIVSSFALSQKPYQLEFTNENYKGFKKNIENKFKDSSGVVQYLKDLRFSAIKSGFLTASIDSFIFVDKKCRCTFYLGPKFDRLKLHFSPEDLTLLKKSKFSEKVLTNQSFQPQEIQKLMLTLQETLMANGFPFAKITLKIEEVDEKESHGKVSIEKNKFLQWSKIIVKGDTVVSSSFLSNLLQIKIGQPYDESQVKKISSRIEQVPYLSEIKPLELLFTQDGVHLYLYLKSKPISSINGFLGLQPDPIKNKYFLTGEIALKLQNVLKKGELLEFNWRNIQTQTQQLNTHLNIPFLVKTPFGMDGQFKLYKRDSTFLDLKTKIAAQYFMKLGNTISFFYERNSSSLLGGATLNSSFTNLSNVKTNNYGVSIQYKKVDYLPNPSRGWNFNSSFAIGQRQSQLTDTSAKIKSEVFKGELQLEIFIPIAKRQVIRISNQSFTFNSEEVFQNELIRFGGLLSQRGFNEDEIYASTVSIFSLEYRFLLDKNSRLFVFYDQSIYENTSITYRKDQPFGMGAGISFGTNLGIFSVQYALGKQLNNPILFKNGKVHFGYVAYF